MNININGVMPVSLVPGSVTDAWLVILMNFTFIASLHLYPLDIVLILLSKYVLV